eukprot:s1821_g2.t2
MSARARGPALLVETLHNTRLVRTPYFTDFATGAYSVCDVVCGRCSLPLAKKYVDASEPLNRFKVGKYLLERTLIYAPRCCNYGASRAALSKRSSDDTEVCARCSQQLEWHVTQAVLLITEQFRPDLCRRLAEALRAEEALVPALARSSSADRSEVVAASGLPWKLSELCSWPGADPICRLRGGRRGVLRSADLCLGPGEVALALGVSGAGKTTLLELLSEGSAEAADELYLHPDLSTPMEVLNGDSGDRNAEEALAVLTPEIRDAWGLADKAPLTARTARWKALCAQVLAKQLRAQIRPLRTRFAADVYTAARKLRFAAVMATHCLAGDVSWMKDACSEVWILSGGRLRKHRPSRPDGYEEMAMSGVMGVHSVLQFVDRVAKALTAAVNNHQAELASEGLACGIVAVRTHDVRWDLLRAAALSCCHDMVGAIMFLSVLSENEQPRLELERLIAVLAKKLRLQGGRIQRLQKAAGLQTANGVCLWNPFALCARVG